jgi:hypothetical protein
MAGAREKLSASLIDSNMKQVAVSDSAGSVGASDLTSLKYLGSEISLAKIHPLRCQLVAEWPAMSLQACPQYGLVWSYTGPLIHNTRFHDFQLLAGQMQILTVSGA